MNQVPDEGDRFVAELEFVQCLSAPHYLNCEFPRVNHHHIDSCMDV